MDAIKDGCVSCQRCTNFYRIGYQHCIFTGFIVGDLYTSRAGSLFFTLKYSWVCQETLADLKPKPWGKCMEKPLSISKTVQHLLGAFFYFSPSVTRGEKKFPKGWVVFYFLAKCCHLSAPECNCLQSANHPRTTLVF